MTDNLHDVLDKTAGLAGSATFDADALWRQGSRAKHRSVALTLVGAVVVLALLSLTVWWGATTSTPQPATPPSKTLSPAMPSHLYDPPSDVATADGLDVGPLAAVFVPWDNHVPIGVSAIDGSYRALDLPGFDPILSLQLLVALPSVAVSPDGGRAAYGWHAPPPVRSGPHVPSGVRVVDLTTGRIVSYRVPGERGAICGAVSWSPSGLFLVSACWMQRSFEQSGNEGTDVRLVRLNLTTGQLSRVPGPPARGLAGVDDRGVVAVQHGRVVSTWALSDTPVQGRVPTTIRGEDASVAWVDGSTLAIAGTSGANATVQLLNVNPEAGAGPTGLIAGRAARLLGQVRTGAVAAWANGSGGAAAYVLAADGRTVRRVSYQGWTPPTDISLATHLLQHPTRDTPDPSAVDAWGQVRHAMPYVAVGVVLALALLAVLLVLRRERLTGEG